VNLALVDLSVATTASNAHAHAVKSRTGSYKPYVVSCQYTHQDG